MKLSTYRIWASEHPVTSVMVLKSCKAEVSRKFDVPLKDGRNKITIVKLPTTIERQSVRISLLKPDGTPSEKTHLSDTVCSTAEGTGDDPIKNVLRSLEIKKSGLQSEKRMLDTQAEAMVTYARTLTSAKTLSGEPARATDVETFFDSFIDRGKKNINAAMRIDEQIAEVDAQIEKERLNRAQTKGTLKTELGLVVVANGDQRIQLCLTYIVNNTKWTPVYELHAVTGKDGRPSRKVELHYHASVKQATGEDWTDASLTLSTVATDAMMKTIPSIQPMRIHVSQPLLPIIIARDSSPRSFRRSARSWSRSRSRCHSPPRRRDRSPDYLGQPGVHSSFRVTPDFHASQEAPPDDTVLALSDDDETSGVELERGRTTEAPIKLVNQTPMTLTYAVRGKSDIPSDGKDHTLTITILTFETDVEYISVPKVDPRVFLQCTVKNDTEYRILPGPVSVILDGNYVSRTRFLDVKRNDTFTFTLGDDPSVAISYERISNVSKEGIHTFAEPIDITTYNTTIIVHNTHSFPIENLAIRDAVPVPGPDKRIKILLRKPQELIEAEEGDLVEVRETAKIDPDMLRVKWEKKEEGLYEYRWRVGANDKVEFETLFDIKAPSELTYSFSNFRTKDKV